MEPDPILENLLRFLAQFDPDDLRYDGLLEELLLLIPSVAADDLAALSDPGFPHELIPWSEASVEEEERLHALRQLDWRLNHGANAGYRLFRREMPLAQTIIAGSQPEWAAGAVPERTLGPLAGRDGRRYWFDLYPITRLVPLYRPGEEEPALLFYVSTIPDPHKDTDLPNKLLAGSKKISHDLEPGSFSVRADVLALHGPQQGYITFKIDGGRIQLSEQPQFVQGRLTIPTAAFCSVSLRLSKQPTDDVDMQTPNKLAFGFSQSQRGTRSVGTAHWSLFGQPISLNWDQKGRPFYHKELKAVLVPLRPSKQDFTVQNGQSAFARVEGGAAIRRAAWVLPVGDIDVRQPLAVQSNGGLAVEGNSDLSLTWRGLRDGPIFLPQPWIVQFPNLLLIVDLQAGNLHAEQRFFLWQDEDSPYRSSVQVRYTDSFPLIYAAGSQGAELVLAQVNAEAKLDRPVDAAGKALDILSEKSLLVLSYTETLRLVYLHDNNILGDGADGTSILPNHSPKPIALALRNALLTTTPVAAFLLFAELLDDELVDAGNVLLLFGLHNLLPTLPDPYAANTGVFGRRARQVSEQQQIMMLLLSHIRWRKEVGGRLDDVQTNFHLLPLGPAAQELLSHHIGTPSTDPLPWFDRENARLLDSSWQAVWQRFFDRFEQEQFALLDVSTKADWMGVSLGWFDQETVQDDDRVFYQVYGAHQTGEDSQNLFPLQVQGLDLTAEGRFVRAFTVPQNSWEPMINLTSPSEPTDPPLSGDLPDMWIFHPSDGGATRLFNTNRERVPIAPLSKVEELLSYFDRPGPGFTGALFTLPFGLKAFAEINKNHPTLPNAGLRLNRQRFRDGLLKGALQIQVDAPQRDDKSPTFVGSTLQMDNIVKSSGQATFSGTLGMDVGTIFNNEFFGLINGYGDNGVPLTRIDFAGYGSSTFSRWENPSAAIAATSQARFDLFAGRTAHEVIQVKSLIYPWGIRVVRTIVIFRAGSGHVYRYDTGWQAESDGVYDFSYRVNVPGQIDPVLRDNPYSFHPGVVKGVFNVRNITNARDIEPFKRRWIRGNPETYIDENGVEQVIAENDVTDDTPDAELKSPHAQLQPVYFDADVAIDYVKSGVVDGRTPSRRMLGYVQLAPKGQPISPELFRELLREQFGSLGGPVDCLIDIGETGQQMRVTRVDVSESADAGGKPLFAGTARGSVLLPKEGSWSVVRYLHDSKEVSPMADGAAVPLIRRGLLGDVTNAPLRLDNPLEMIRSPQPESIFFGLLQSTGTQKALFRNPRFKEGLQELLSEPPDFADAYRMLDSAGIFPNLNDTFPLDLGAHKTKIIEEGYRLLDEANPDKILEKALPDGPWFIIDDDFLKLYIDYDKLDKAGVKQADGKINFGFDSAAQDIGKRWLSKLNNIAMVVDLGPLKRLMMIKGKFDAEKGAAPSFLEPELEFSDELQAVTDILQVLLMLQGGDYVDALSKGLEIAMSNSADSWAYAFHARKEIPLLRFPPPALDSPTAPLKLECSLGLGVYFNEVFSLTDNANQLIPSAGAFLSFFGRLSVMCVSLAAATVYAVGSVELRLSADVKTGQMTGQSLFMAFGFGAEINVGLPVIGNVSLLYMVGVEIVLDSGGVVTAAFLLYRGRAEIAGGLVSVTITIEAKGIIERVGGATNISAQVTFGLDVSVFLVININFSESWQETRQIA